MRHLLPALFLFLSVGPSLRAEDQPTVPVPADPPVPAAAEEKVAVAVRGGPLAVSIDADGHLEAAQVRRLKPNTELWTGPLFFSEIAPSDQPVEAGAVLARLDSPKFSRWVRSLGEGLENAKFRLGVVNEELAALRRTQAQRLERDMQDLDKVLKDWEDYQAFVVEQRTRRMNNDLQRAENALAVAETEFTQLERMYRESRIADDTKEIVLDRTRKNLATQREATELARREHQQFFADTLPDEKREWQRNLERRRQDLETVRTAQVLAERQKVDDLAKAERAVRDAQESLDLALGDQQRLIVIAPFAGIFKHHGVEIGETLGDTLGKNAGFLELHRSDAIHVRVGLPPQEVAILKVGDRLRVQVADLGRDDLDGEIISLGSLANRDAQGAVRVLATIRVANDPRARIGLKARIRHPVILPETLIVPRACISSHKGEPVCDVRRADGTSERRVVMLGLGNADQVQVLAGLQADEVVLLPAKRKSAP